jgi:hypothetical protein
MVHVSHGLRYCARAAPLCDRASIYDFVNERLLLRIHAGAGGGFAVEINNLTNSLCEVCISVCFDGSRHRFDEDKYVSRPGWQAAAHRRGGVGK